MYHGMMQWNFVNGETDAYQPKQNGKLLLEGAKKIGIMIIS